MNLSVFTDLLTVCLFPKRCAFCGKVIKLNQNLCKDCEKEEKISNACRRCGLPKESCSCDARTIWYDEIDCIYLYEGNVRRGLLHYKNGGDKRVAEFFSREMANRCKENLSFSPDAVVYVPMTKKEREKRGFDQGREIAMNIAERLNLPLYDSLIKLYETKPQKSLHIKMRNGNVAGVFDLKDGAKIEGKRFILIDDIKTSGATISECAKMLKLYGAEYVYALTFAAVLHKKKRAKK